MTRMLAIAIALSASGCGERDAPSPAPRPSVPDRWTCTSDADCLNSCRWGAVSRAWYDPNQRECKDGCNDQLSAPPRCLDGGCVAFWHDPHDERRIIPRDECTRRP